MGVNLFQDGTSGEKKPRPMVGAFFCQRRNGSLLLLRLIVALNADQLNIEYQCCVRPNHLTCTTGTVSQLRGNIQFPLGTEKGVNCTDQLKKLKNFVSRFQGSWGVDGSMYQTVIFSHLKTFRFTGTPALYIECDVRMCHGRCPVS